jgi:hypothetical protein
MILNFAKRQTALFLAGSYNTPPTYFMIGSGSGTLVNTQTTLFNPTDRQLVTMTNGSNLYQITWTGDWNSVEMSGLSLNEWGMTISGGATTGSMWSKSVIPALTFDGTSELRIEETWTIN